MGRRKAAALGMRGDQCSHHVILSALSTPNLSPFVEEWRIFCPRAQSFGRVSTEKDGGTSATTDEIGGNVHVFGVSLSNLKRIRKQECSELRSHGRCEGISSSSWRAAASWQQQHDLACRECQGYRGFCRWFSAEMRFCLQQSVTRVMNSGSSFYEASRSHCQVPAN
jgi:hypothetical protein